MQSIPRQQQQQQQHRRLFQTAIAGKGVTNDNNNFNYRVLSRLVFGAVNRPHIFIYIYIHTYIFTTILPAGDARSDR
jgi:hypothetical protein